MVAAVYRASVSAPPWAAMARSRTARTSVSSSPRTAPPPSTAATHHTPTSRRITTSLKGSAPRHADGRPNSTRPPAECEEFQRLLEAERRPVTAPRLEVKLLKLDGERLGAGVLIAARPTFSLLGQTVSRGLSGPHVLPSPDMAP